MNSSLTSAASAKRGQKREVLNLTEVVLDEDDFTGEDLHMVHANGGKYQKWFKSVLRQFIDELTMELVFEVDFDLTWEEALKAGGYDSQYIDSAFNTTKLPSSNLVGKHQVRVGLNKRDKTTTNQEWLDYLKGLGEPFIHPLVLLALGAKFRDKQRVAPIFVLWFDLEGQLWGLALSESDGYRHVNVGRYGLGHDWDDYCLGASARK